MNVPSLLFGFVVNFLLPLVLYLMATGRTTALAGREHDERARNGAELHERAAGAAAAAAREEGEVVGQPLEPVVGDVEHDEAGRQRRQRLEEVARGVEVLERRAVPERVPGQRAQLVVRDVQVHQRLDSFE